MKNILMMTMATYALTAALTTVSSFAETKGKENGGERKVAQIPPKAADAPAKEERESLFTRYYETHEFKNSH